MSRWMRLAGAALALAAGDAAASTTARHWWFGEWTCTIDGRPARMSWRNVDDTRQSCEDGVCTTVAGVRTVGRFSDNGSAWVPLTVVSTQGATFRLRHADGNVWRLVRRNANLAEGNTVWNGRAYPLSCRR